jgi:hypothetical protein
MTTATILPMSTTPARPIARRGRIAEQVLFLDGLSGTGKTMMGPVLGSLARVEAHRFDHIHEYVCALRFLGRLEHDAAVAMVRLYADLACYNGMIARESNFRWTDLSGVLGSPGGWRYLQRLFLPDGAAVMQRIERERPIVQIASHYALGAAQPLFDAFGQRLTVVEMVRHPLYLVQHGSSYIDRFGADARDFTIWFDYEGRQLPWFAAGWEAQYLDSTPTDRVIYMMDRLMRLAQQQTASLPDSLRAHVVVVPFERFVLEPWPYLDEICARLDTRRTRHTTRVLRAQRVPRRMTVGGRDKPIYRRYRWMPVAPGTTERQEYDRRWSETRALASPAAVAVLERLSADYEAAYWRPA